MTDKVVQTETLSSGVVVSFKRVSSLLTAELLRKNKKPEPPVVFIEDLGRSEENLSDPSYLERVKDWELEISMKMVDMMIMLGVTVVSVPDSVPSLESEDWVDALKVVGIDVGTNPKERFVKWFKYIAAPEDEDIEKITTGVGRLSGASEEDVQSAADRFRGDKER